MTLQMHYQEKYEEGLEQGATNTALKMLESGKLSMEEIAGYSGLTLERVEELGEKLQIV